jgi:hypothetical protein
MRITNFNSNISPSPPIDVKELKRQIQVLQMENDAKYQEVEDFRRRLHLTIRDNRHLRQLLIKLGQEMVEEGCSVNDLYCGAIPGWIHWEAVKRIFQYLKGMRDLSLVYGEKRKDLQGWVGGMVQTSWLMMLQSPGH